MKNIWRAQLNVTIQVGQFRCASVGQFSWASKQRKVNRPSYGELKRDVELMGYVATGKKYGVSDNSIRKWLKFYESHPEILN